MWWTQTTAPDGWLICDGSQISRTTYSDLFLAIGTTFGSGDGSTTFTLPDLRAAFVRGAGSQNGYSATFGQMQGATSIIAATDGNALSLISLGNPDKTDSGGEASSAGYSSRRPYSRYYMRPYNMALTPIIKY